MSRVGQFFGKLFAGQSGKNAAVLRAYGKLPFYAEYRRLEVSPGVPTVFSQWLDQGRLAWARGTPEGSRGTMRTARVVLRWRGQRDWAIATIWDSRDSLGRPFPFSFFVTCPPEWLGDGPLERSVSCLALHEYFDELHGQLFALGSGGDFYHLYQKQTVPARLDDLVQRTKDVRERARQITLGEWISTAGLGNLPAGEWFAGLLRRAERWRAIPAGGELALSCPLAHGPAYAAQVILWLEWLAGLRPASDMDPCLILPAPSSPEPARMQVLFRELLPGDFQLLTTDAAKYGYVEDLGQLPPGATPDPAAPATALPAGSLLEALTRPAP